MRYLLLVFLLALQGSVFGYSSNNRAEDHAQKTLTSEKSDLNARRYHFFRYYSPESGTYASQDPVGLAGGIPNMYSYTVDTNTLLDPFGTKQITFRAAFNQVKRDLGIPKNVNTPKPVKVWDSAFENRHVWAFEG